MNVIARLEFELGYYLVAVQRINNYVSENPPNRMRISNYGTLTKAECDIFFLFFQSVEMKDEEIRKMASFRHIIAGS